LKIKALHFYCSAFLFTTNKNTTIINVPIKKQTRKYNLQ